MEGAVLYPAPFLSLFFFFWHEKNTFSVPVLGMKEESFSVWNVSGASLLYWTALTFA